MVSVSRDAAKVKEETKAVVKQRAAAWYCSASTAWFASAVMASISVSAACKEPDALDEMLKSFEEDEENDGSQDEKQEDDEATDGCEDEERENEEATEQDDSEPETIEPTQVDQPAPPEACAHHNMHAGSITCIIVHMCEYHLAARSRRRSSVTSNACCP